MIVKKIVQNTLKLVESISTKNNKEGLDEVLEIAKSELEGFDFKEFEKNDIKSLLFYNKEHFPEKFKIILNAHLDVVPCKPEQFKPYIKDGKLYGRGANDMKTAAAVFIVLFKKITDKVDYPLGLQLVTDEEVGGFNGTKHQIDQGVKADFIIGGEATDMAINTQAKGILRLHLTAKGQSAHAAYPWQGENALVKLNKVLLDLMQRYQVPSQEKWITTFNLAWVKTDNETVNKVPDKAEAVFDVRFIPQDGDGLKDNIKAIVGDRAEVNFPVDEPAQYTDKNNKYVQKMKKVIEDVTGEDCKFIKKHGGSDLRHYERAGIEGMLFGPVGGGLHTDNEWVRVEKLAEYYKILHSYLLKLNE